MEFGSTATLPASDIYRLLDRARPAGAVTSPPSFSAPQQIIQDLNRIAALKPGWDSYGAPAISRNTLGQTLRLVLSVYRTASTLALKLPEPRLFPSGDGKVGLFWKRGDSNLEVLVGETTIEAVGSEHGKVFEGEIEPEEPLDVLTLIHRHLISA